MTSEDFKAFLNKQTQVKKQEDTIDWEAKKTQWIKHANEFVNDVRKYLSEFSEITTSTVSINITEDKLGSYQAPKLIIHLPKEIIELIPIGTLLIGAHGRFDMKGLAGTVKWVLVPVEAEKPTVKLTINDKDQPADTEESDKLVWKVATPAPNIRYLSFTKDILLEAIMEVSHG